LVFSIERQIPADYRAANLQSSDTGTRLPAHHQNQNACAHDGAHGTRGRVYDRPESLTSALASTSCKQQGVHSLRFARTVDLPDGRQLLVVFPDLAKVSNKKAEIQLQTVKCSDNCQLPDK
jgi:hypothetical protein